MTNERCEYAPEGHARCVLRNGHRGEHSSNITEVLVVAINERWRDYVDAIDTLYDCVNIDRAETKNIYGAKQDLREAVELVQCLRRILRGRSPDEIHKAFGAPGDFGYESDIGHALAVVYVVVKP